MFTEQANQIKNLHAESCGLQQQSLAKAKAAGELLAHVYAEIGDYKDFITWCRSECEISEATANNYIRIHRQWKKLPHENLNYTEALAALRTTRKPKAALEPIPLTPWQVTVQEAMEKFQVKGSVESVCAFLEHFGVKGDA